MALSPEQVRYQLDHVNENRAPAIIIPHAVCLSLAIVAVALRFISRGIKAGFKADDWVMLFSLILTVGECTGVLVGTIKYGGAKHAITLKDPVMVAKITMAVQQLYTAGISSAKISVLLMYRRVFVSHRFHLALWAIGIFIFAYSFVQFLVILLQCNPVNGAWEVTTVKAKCIQLMLEIEVMGILNAITDIITVCLPMPMLWRLQMPARKKCQVMGTFLVGGFVCIVSIYRVPMEAGISLVDASYTDVTGCIWSFVEVSVAIVCACLPTLRPLLRWCVIAVKGEPQMAGGEFSSPSGVKEILENKDLGSDTKHEAWMSDRSDSTV